MLYHSIDTRAAPGYKDWALPPSLFSEHMSVLSREGYTTWTISQFVRESIIACQPPPEKTVVITFDDAFQDFADNALPVLAEHQFAVTLYVPTGYVGKTASWLREEGEDGRCLMGWDQLRGLSATYPIEYGAHSCTHAHLDILPEIDARREIETSKSMLEDRLGMSAPQSVPRAAEPLPLPEPEPEPEQAPEITLEPELQDQVEENLLGDTDAGG